MKKLLLPLGLAIVGIGGGIGAGVMLRPGPQENAVVCGPADGADLQADAQAALSSAPAAAHEAPGDKNEFIKLNNQFIVPIVSTDRVDALVVLSLSVEMAPGNSELVYQREPKLRDGLLQALFDHANRGGFRGTFTDTARLDVLRRGLLEVAQSVLGSAVSDILITDIGRQDV